MLICDLILYRISAYTTKEIPVYKDWKEICKIENGNLRMFVAAETDSEILEKLQLGFPEFFSEEEKDLVVPLSVIREAYSREDDDFIVDVPDHFSLPVLSWGNFEASEGMTLPLEFRSIAKNLPLNSNGSYLVSDPGVTPVYLKWQGQQYLLLECLDYFADGQVEYFFLVPPRFVDLTC